MKHLSISLLLAFLLPTFYLGTLHAQTAYDWGLAAGSSKRDEVTDLALDAQGNVFVTGVFEDSMDMANGSATEYIHSNGFKDIFLAKYDATGTKAWAFSIGALGWDRGWSMAIDPQSNSYIGGVFTNRADFDPGPDSLFLRSNPAGFWPDGYLAKYNPEGELVWAKHLLTARDRSGSQSATLLSITGMEIDAQGDLVIGGAFWDTVWVAPNQMIVSDGPLADLFIAKYDQDGNFKWVKQMGGSGDQRIQSLAIDPQGNIAVTGFFFGNPDLNPAGGAMLSSQGGEDIFIAKYDPTGNFLWAHGIGSPNGAPVSPESGLDIGSDAMGNIYLTGRLLGDADFDPNTSGGEFIADASNNLYCAKYSPSGALTWFFGLAGGSYKLGKRLSVQANGDFWLGGEYGASFAQGGMDVDPGPDTVAISSLGGAEDIFIAKYDKDANFITVREIRGTGDSKLEGLVGNDAHVAFGGYFDRSLLLDRPSGDLRLSRGAQDIFAVKWGEESMSLDQTAAKSLIRLSPNPCSDQLTIRFTNGAQVDQVKMINLQGQVVLNSSVLSSKMYLSLSHLSQQTYLLTFWKAGKLVGKEKVVKR